MKTLLHGENIERSREEFTLLKQTAKGELREIQGKSIDETALTQALCSDALFDEQITVCIENLFSGLGKKTKTASVFASIIKNAPKDMAMILWEQKELGKEILSLLDSTVSIRLFAYPKIIFSFLDAVQPGNSKRCLSLLDELLTTEPAELIWSMLIGRIRTLMQLNDHVTPERMSSWQLSRLTNQARLFTMDKLLIMHQNLLTSEFQLKQGNSPYSTAESLHIVVATL